MLWLRYWWLAYQTDSSIFCCLICFAVSWCDWHIRERRASICQLHRYITRIINLKRKMSFPRNLWGHHFYLDQGVNKSSLPWLVVGYFFLSRHFLACSWWTWHKLLPNKSLVPSNIILVLIYSRWHDEMYMMKLQMKFGIIKDNFEISLFFTSLKWKDFLQILIDFCLYFSDYFILWKFHFNFMITIHETRYIIFKYFL